MPSGEAGQRIAGTILAGGLGRRLGGEKPLHFLLGKSLIEHVIDRFEKQVDELWLNAGGGWRTLEKLNLPIIRDAPEHANRGPLAGIVASLRHARSRGIDHIAVVPCDAPFIPRDLVPTLARSLSRSSAPGIVVATPHGLQPTIGLWSVSLLGTVTAALEAGRGRLQELCNELQFAVWDCRINGYSEESFFNINTRADLALAEIIGQRSSTELRHCAEEGTQ